MVHISEISAEKRINHPQEVLKVGQRVKAQVLAVDLEKRVIRLSMKQLVPTSLDEYLSEHKEGDLVTGRLAEVTSGTARVELGEGVFAVCPLATEVTTKIETNADSKTDLSALSSMLSARWKGGFSAAPSSPAAARAGQIRSFRITRLNPETKQIELRLA